MPGLLPFAMVALVMLSLMSGGVPIGVHDVLSALTGPSGPADSGAAMAQAIVRDLRLPRVLPAMAVGGALALVGSLLQTTTRNDLADPFLFGLSSGASAGAVAVITFAGT
ncbi:iron chelate uptake ABC transporter family permease subunit, partial [Raoultella sp. 18084]|uniref:iron chelate uptake ABC transporter family permease subunit n=1 Tax=Raoultella sp. 18084 TaxID=2681416 RepID=UPI0013573C7E